jgi:uncharacterized protein
MPLFLDRLLNTGCEIRKFLPLQIVCKEVIFVLKLSDLHKRYIKLKDLTRMETVGIAGASGFIGYNLRKRLEKEGYQVKTISRTDFLKGNLDIIVKECSIMINLAGESIAGLWTEKKKRKIYDSRILPTRKLIESISRSGNQVKLFIQISGVGIYDRHGVHTEESNKFEDGFLSRVIKDWEGETTNLGRSEIRVVIMRLGIVLDKRGGFLKQMLFPLKWAPGFGVQSEDYFPYVELEDLLNAFLFCIHSREIKGIVNVVAPGLTKINHFFSVLMEISGKKKILWFGRWLIKLVAGESSGLLLTGQNVKPAKLINHGFVFRYDNIEDALIKACN